MKWFLRTKSNRSGRLGSVALALTLVVFLSFIEPGATVKCYKCQVSPSIYKIGNHTNSTPLCSKFDESDDYITDCPYSTMCVKEIIRLYLGNSEPYNTVTRGCANQKYTDQVLRQGAWRMEHKVEEPYKEGCTEFKENDLSGSTKTYCYCRGNLCNSAKKNDLTNGLHADAMAVIFVFNAMKYLNNGFNRL